MIEYQMGIKRKYLTPEEMLVEIDIYLMEEEDYTITGLALALGFDSRQSIYDYEKRDEFSYIIKRAKLFVEMSYEDDLRTQYSSGSIFALKNMGWTDKSEIEQTVTTQKAPSIVLETE